MTQTRKLIDENGKRTDGRGIDELRTVKITVGHVKNADGSAFIEFGKNRILAAGVWPPRSAPKAHGTSRQVRASLPLSHDALLHRHAQESCSVQKRNRDL